MFAIAALATIALAQQPGKQKDNKKPPLQMSTCTSSGCNQQTKAVVLDSNWMWAHKVGDSTNCYTGDDWDKTLCPDPVTCAENCALDGGDYGATYGVTTSGDEIDLKFVTKGQYGSNVGSRTFLMDGDDSFYMFKLLNNEFTFDVDASQLPCGLNGALYFVAMDADGGMSKYPSNKAGAAYGTGYCDAQCPHDIKFIDGAANIKNWTTDPSDPNSGTGMYGTCCTEMDIWESNSISEALTPHACSVTGQHRCNGTECGDGAQRDDGVCDKDGADFNPFRLGDKGFYGPGANFTVDSTQKITVVTQFITSDNTDTGDLVEIRRFYVQNGKTIPTGAVSVGGKMYDSITDGYVNAQKTLFGDTNTFEAKGGLKAMGEQMANGMVLVMSLWADYAVNMLWLDSDYPPSKPVGTPGVARGTCSTSSGVPSTIIENNPDATVKYSNIKIGTINSTFPSGPPGPPSPPGPPTPNNCPGGSLSACMALCPSNPPAAYKACVADCVQRCPTQRPRDQQL